MSHSADVFARTPAEQRRAYDQMVRVNVEIAVCANCGAWARWDSELFPPAQVCFDGEPHLITRVSMRAIPPSRPRARPSDTSLRFRLLVWWWGRVLSVTEWWWRVRHSPRAKEGERISDLWPQAYQDAIDLARAAPLVVEAERQARRFERMAIKVETQAQVTTTGESE